MATKKTTEDEIVDTPTENTVETAPAEEKPKRTRKAAATTEEAPTEGGSVLESVLTTVAETIGKTAADVVNVVAGPADAAAPNARAHKRAERIGIVASDKMEKTVTVRVDRLVKHPVYRKYVKKRKKFMAHDETGAKIGDKVRIVETRPLSARKRWRVVEIIQKAEL
ncbi:MAG TPA: 30S ribosomal protein S17 [Pyrinomonadaceae bacterium]|nr:30S ribosomal protein S17 [Pyrinomonadaceae bacterium]